MSSKRKLTGTVISNKMNKTIVVGVKKLFKHPKYKKYIRKTKKYKVHDEKKIAKIGDVVEIIECRPISKEKHFRLSRILKSSTIKSEISEINDVEAKV